MKIISHRGYWKTTEEKNTNRAFDRSFALGYGTETDIRDHCQALIISHDMPAGNEISFSEFLRKANDAVRAHPLTLALNIKADGLAQAIAGQIKQYPLLDCFAFDMSVPDMQSYIAAHIPFFTRMSEVEQYPAWLDRAAGVWLDAFESEWYQVSDIQRLLSLGKRVCVVSSELHHRPHHYLWQSLIPISQEPGLIICTDLPEEATKFFKSNGVTQ